MSESSQNSDLQFQIVVLEKLSALQANIAASDEEMKSSVVDIQSHVRTIRSELSELDNVLKNTLGHIVADQVGIRTEIMARIDRLRATVDLVREDARVNWATADTAMNRVKNYREEIDNLTAMISAMERRYQTLSSIVDGLRDPDGRKSPGS